MPFPAILIEAILLGVEDAATPSEPLKQDDNGICLRTGTPHSRQIASLLQATSFDPFAALPPIKTTVTKMKPLRRKRRASTLTRGLDNAATSPHLAWHTLPTDLPVLQDPELWLPPLPSSGESTPSFGSHQIKIFDRKQARKEAKSITRQQKQRENDALLVPRTINSFFLFKQDIDRAIRRQFENRPIMLDYIHATATIPKIAGILWRYLHPASKAMYRQAALTWRLHHPLV